MVGFVLIGLLTALGVVFTINVEPLWEAVVKANFVYQQPFPYGKAMRDLWGFLTGRPATSGCCRSSAASWSAAPAPTWCGTARGARPT